MPNVGEHLLDVQNIVMDFQSVRALEDVSIAFQAGEVHGVIGENGAGKSTLMKILSGVQQPTSGRILLNGKGIVLSGTRSAQSNGIAMIHQELNLVDELTVAENVFLGRELLKGGLLNRAEMHRQTDEFLAQISAPFGAEQRVADLSIAGKQLVEIAKAVAVDASILIMDEPTAVLSEPEAESLFKLVARLKAQGVTVLYISHRLKEVCEICDRITVLRDGRWVATVDAKGANPAALASLMVGRDMGDFFPEKAAEPIGPPALEVENVRGASLSVQAGEILGLAGLVGAGRTELAQSIVGVRPSPGGHVRVGGKACRIRSPKEALKNGIAYVSEDRKGLGLHTTLSARENVTMANLREYGRVVLDQRRERLSAESWKKDLDIRASDLDEPVGNVSGGNQQKIAIAKWLETKPRVLIVDEPTRGVDVGAKREMYGLIKRLAEGGMACLVISSDLPEIIGLCHRALVMREGRIAGELKGGELTEEAAMHLAAGVQ